jgi:DNA-binding transcriptional LysR family regulator
MELRHLRYFIAAAEAENVSRAAVKLHVSQPGISRQIHDLEDEIGFQLFERGAKSLKLTAAGRIFLVEARAVLQHADDAVQKARAVAAGTAGEIHVGYAPSLTIQILPRTLRTFLEEFPRVRVTLHDLSTEEMLAQLGDGSLDVALSVQPPARRLRGLKFAELARYPINVAVSPKHRLAKSKSLTLEQIEREPFLAYSRTEYPEYYQTMEELFAQAGHKPQLAGEYDGITSLIAAVEAGRGYALVAGCAAFLAGHRVKLIPLTPAPPPIPVGAVWRKEPETQLVKQFITSAKRHSELAPNV